MAAALQTVKALRHLRRKELIINITLSGNYVAGGDTVDFTTLTAVPGLGDAQVGFPGNIDLFEVISVPFGYSAVLIKGTALNNWKLKIEQTGAAVNSAFAELAAAAYPAGLITPNFVQISISGPKGQI